ncbi:MAG: HipA N-terminal domain-containing protein [Bdellovibrionota bacterium]
MRKAEVFVKNVKAGVFIEISQYEYEFVYESDYQGSPVSVTLPLKTKQYKFNSFPAVFEGLLPEGVQLEALLRDKKINRSDLFKQLMVCGADCVGAVSVKELA